MIQINKYILYGRALFYAPHWRHQYIYYCIRCTSHKQVLSSLNRFQDGLRKCNCLKVEQNEYSSWSLSLQTSLQQRDSERLWCPWRLQYITSYFCANRVSSDLTLLGVSDAGNDANWGDFIEEVDGLKWIGNCTHRTRSTTQWQAMSSIPRMLPTDTPESKD